MTFNYSEHETVNLKTDPNYDEKWVEDKIKLNPSIIGLGDLTVKDSQRHQPKAGRLDLLLQDDDSNRYVTEIQLGPVDESHIIRTIEYWDIEKKRYRDNEHFAVIIAEDITSRFFNVISLFNGAIPLIAIQMNAIKIENNISLVFTKILDHVPLGSIGKDEEVPEEVERPYWENKGTKETVALADDMLELVKNVSEDSFKLNYNRYYIGLTKNRRSNNFVFFKPQKNFLKVGIKAPESEEAQNSLEAEKIPVEYNKRDSMYTIKLYNEKDIKSNEASLSELVQAAYDRSL